MDLEHYDQYTLGGGGRRRRRRLPGGRPGAPLAAVQRQVLTIELPTTVDLLVVDTAPTVKGATAQAQLKPATLETGLEILVPPISQRREGAVDTRDGRFVERVKE